VDFNKTLDNRAKVCERCTIRVFARYSEVNGPALIVQFRSVAGLTGRHVFMVIDKIKSFGDYPLQVNESS
jgi:hypothetical protein